MKGKLFAEKDLKVGGRNTGLFYNAMRYAKYQENTSVEDIFQFIQAINIELDTPLEDDEVMTIATSTYKYKTKNEIYDTFGKVDSIRDKKKNEEQLKQAREEYIHKKYLENKNKVQEAIEYFIANDEKVNVSKMAKYCGVNRRAVKQILIEEHIESCNSL